VGSVVEKPRTKKEGKMNQADLRVAIESAIQEKCMSSIPFTGLCISKPIIEKNPELRHKRDVKPIIDDMWANGSMVGVDEDGIADIPYTRSMIDVAGGKYQAWLYHSPNFDPANFSETDLSLSRKKPDPVDVDAELGSVTPTTAARFLDLSEEDDNSPFECKAQDRRACLNIPRAAIRMLKWKQGDHLVVTSSASPYSFKVNKVRRTQPFNQIVDKEGRVRLHGIYPSLPAKVTVKNKEILVWS
jgi:hypothetical protein